MRNFKLLAILCDCTARLVWDLVENPEDRLSHNEAQIITDRLNVVLLFWFSLLSVVGVSLCTVFTLSGCAISRLIVYLLLQTLRSLHAFELVCARDTIRLIALQVSFVGILPNKLDKSQASLALTLILSVISHDLICFFFIYFPFNPLVTNALSHLY